MKKIITMILLVGMVVGITSCGLVDRAISKGTNAIVDRIEDQIQEAVSGELGMSEEQIDEFTNMLSGAGVGVTDGFPIDIPIYEGADILETDNFNGNNYTILYQVDTSYEDVNAFYIDAFDLDVTGSDDGMAYYEAFDYGDIFVKGLTIEDVGDRINVYMTVQDNGQEEQTTEDNGQGYATYDVMTYDTAEEVSLDGEYPEDLIPIPTGAKIVDSSMIPGTSSGFISLVMPASEYEDAVSYYQYELGIDPNQMSTDIQESALFNGQVDNILVSIMISHILADGNDTFIQLTLNEQ